MRILFSAAPMFGHVNPVLPLAVAARRAGHEVVFATGPALVPYVERYGLATWAVDSPPNPTNTDWVAHFLAVAGSRVDGLRPRAEAWRPDVVVHEETDLAGAVVAHATGARHVVHGLGPMPPIQLWDVVAPALDRLLAGTTAATRRATYLDICPPALQPPGPRLWSDTQPLRPVVGLPSDGDRLPFTDLPYARTAHLTLGTVFHGSTDVLAAAIAGLTRQPDLNVVVATGPGTAPDAFGPQPPHVVLAPYVPYGLLLPHCDLVVAHGGAGTTFGALAHGLPQLLLPQGADQHRNAHAAAAAGVALVLEAVTEDGVAAAAARLLGDAAFGERARIVQASIAAMPAPDHVVGLRLTACPTTAVS
jgi:UDP:flavonoid glycosyltransferase YjiC (YdhE family)